MNVTLIYCAQAQWVVRFAHGSIALVAMHNKPGYLVEMKAGQTRSVGHFEPHIDDEDSGTNVSDL